MRRLLPTLIAIAALCALAAPAQAATARASIVAGSDASITSAPYQVRVLVRAGDLTYQCGGSIRDSTHVITAAHCVDIDGELAAPGSVTVGYGSAQTSSLQSSAVSEVTMPTVYTSDDSYDIAVLDLSAPLSGYPSSSVNAIPLGSGSELATGVSGESNAFATGWGRTAEGGSTTTQLEGVQLPLRADTVCSALYIGYVAPRTVCAGGKGTSPSGNPDTCQGDSGGPLALEGALVGITSYGNGCGQRLTPGAYTEVSDPEIHAIATGTAPSASLSKGSQRGTPASAPPAATIPVAQTIPAPTPVVAMKDTTRPTARLASLTCKKHRCALRIRTSDPGGAVRSLSVRAARRVRTCRGQGSRRTCRTVTKTRKLSVRRIPQGFSSTVTLAPARYALTAVATDRSGNRSMIVRRTFRVKR